MKDYHRMIDEVLTYGTRKENRTGVDTISTFNYNYELTWDERLKGSNTTYVGDPNGHGDPRIPLLTTKDVSWKNIVVEMLWFLSGSANLHLLEQHKCRFWDPWKDEWGHLGPVYGKQWRRWETLHMNPPMVFDPPSVTKSEGKPKRVSGVGIYVRGDKDTLPYGDLLYNTWSEMLSRCYDETREHYKWYGAKGIHVHERWFEFRNFVSDVQSLEGWDLKRAFPSRYSLDKDFKNSNRYGPDTCIWMNRHEQHHNTTKAKLVRVIRPDGVDFQTLDIGGVCRDYNLDRSTVAKVLRGEREDHKGWKFQSEGYPEGLLPRLRVWDQIEQAIATLKFNPMSRRILVSAWNPAEIHLMRLPPCHLLLAFNVQNVLVSDINSSAPPEFEPRLCLHLTQRSCDLALGIPYNMASYSLLLLIMSHLTGIKPGIFAHSLLDLHIYTSKPDGSMEEYDHIPGLKEQRDREPRPLPFLSIDPAIKDLSDIEDLMDKEVSTETILKKFLLTDYNPHPAIKFKVAV